MTTLNPINKSLGIKSLENNDFLSAEGHLALAFQYDPPDGQSYALYGKTLFALNKHKQAIPIYAHAIAYGWSSADMYFEKAFCHFLAQDYENAIHDYLIGLSLNPVYLPAKINIAIAYFEQNQPARALAYFLEVTAQNPKDDASTLWTAHLHLLLGEFEQGWYAKERRWHLPSHQAAWRDYAQPLWLGSESLANKTILIWYEQGFGDCLQFCRYANQLKARGATVILQVRETMYRLMQSLANVDYLIQPNQPLPHFDYHCPLMSLPLACQTFTEQSIPKISPYLAATVSDVAIWQQRIKTNSKLKIGIVWAGSPTLDSRQIAPEFLLPLAQLEGLTWYSLQVESALSQTTSVQANLWVKNELINWSGEWMDWADTAGLIANLDLIISCDTGVAHLAAAMGKPTWILLSQKACWRWLTNRSDSPWYPTARLFRQQVQGDWTSVIQEVRDALQTHPLP